MAKYVISETSTSTWNYHIREVVDDKLYFSGGAPPAVCGMVLGWDTKMPLSAWGVKDHLPSKWCANCQAIVNGRVISGEEHGKRRT